MHGANQRGVVRQRAGDRRVARRARGDAAGDEARGRNQQARARHLGQAAVMQPAQPPAKFDQGARGRRVDAGALALDDRRLVFGRRKIEIERDEALPRARLQVLEHALVAGVVRDHQLESRRGVQQLAGLVDRQHAPVVAQGVQDDHRVLARLDHLVEVAQRALAHGTGQRPVLPGRAVVADQEAADEVAGAQVVVAGDGHQRPSQPPGHVLDEARLADAGRPLEHHRQPVRMAALEDGDLVAVGEVERLRPELGSEFRPDSGPQRHRRAAALLYFSPAGYFRGARWGRHGKNWFLPPDLLSRATKSGTQVMAFPSRPLKIFSKTTKDRR